MCKVRGRQCDLYAILITSIKHLCSIAAARTGRLGGAPGQGYCAICVILLRLVPGPARVAADPGPIDPPCPPITPGHADCTER
ncbi:hypothetical protein ACN38_g11249 [Penicillium nordicum]|uniref:Uncharacterized protein n=1 Tax=Penicillium nordicum TaxID=229535 RepID=A0A0M9WBA7_9EURO|nr:hypothetical protein ACN38_g11249 [Penicillium nordicum]